MKNDERRTVLEQLDGLAELVNSQQLQRIVMSAVFWGLVAMAVYLTWYAAD